MRAILITTDPVKLSFARSLLADAAIESMLADQYTSAIEGSVGVLPRRLMVVDDVWDRARAALADGGLADDLVPNE